MATNREKCIEMWEWISGQPNGTLKYEYFEEKKITSKDTPDFRCYACQESNDFGAGCCDCPLGYNGNTHCQDHGELFDKWEKLPTKKAATAFLKFIKENWKE